MSTSSSQMDFVDFGNEASSRIQSTYIGPRLPPELCDMIIDNLCGNKQALSTCTLVSHSWKHTARNHLFESVLVARQDDTNAYRNFLNFLNKTPDIGPAIRIICVDGYNPENPVHGVLDCFFIAKVLDYVPKLKALLLLNCGWQRTPAHNMTVYSRPQRTIVDLYINSFRDAKGPPNSKLEILRQFSHIDNLYLTRLWIGHFDVDGAEGDNSSDEDLYPSHSPINVKVKTLTLSLADVCLNFLEHLRRQPFLSTLHALTIRELWSASYLQNHEDLHMIGDIIHDKMSSSLKTFEIDLPRHGPLDGPEVFSALHLGSCHSLDAVAINFLLDGPEMSPAEELEEQTANQNANGTDDDDDEIVVIDTTVPYAGDSEDEEPDSDNPDEGEGNEEDDDADEAAVQQAVTDFTHDGGAPVQASRQEQPRFPPFYTANEWRVPGVILSQLPLSVTEISFAIELTGSAHLVTQHLASAPNWVHIEQQLLRFPNLRRVNFRRLEKLDCDVPVFRRWGMTDQLEICNRLSGLLEKKVLVFDK
ncbi:hypothetical protein BDY19DRAFT_108931 [Irpex rosettiformis]|uniref:Uncharacterized protein n=1 Tax=Irpex rosettiformis TaxID=378272 RepID=A0ACB8U5Y9_9APHY|nr:hypothetical protein BDY19DRAFT_108931 [Irpex rosettiformis]